MLEKHKFKWMLEMPHVKKWITAEPKIRSRKLQLHDINPWLETSPGSEPLNIKAVNFGHPQMLYNKDDHYVTHNYQNQYWIEQHYKKDTLSCVQFNTEG